jgi:hypothetical protein
MILYAKWVDENAVPSIEVKATYKDKTGEIIENGGLITAEEGTTVTLDITCTQGASVLTRVEVFSEIDNRMFMLLDSLMNTGILSGSNTPVKFQFITNTGIKDELLTVKATDKKNCTTEFTLTLRGTAVDPVENEYDYYLSAEVWLGCQKNASYGSFYNEADGKVIMLKEATASKEKVDFACFYSDGCGVGCPKGDVAKTITYGSTTMDGWPNTTNFKRVHGFTTADLNDAWWAEGFEDIAELEITGLVANDAVFFKTSSNKEGAFIVQSVPTTASGFLTVKFVSRNPR